ncbi:low molecular weight protein-tyrosine-phosphatase [Flavitalea sp.]|nr:low molecular weight protein-tyrosine-phosphatase [Flavitalea sp.]
MKILMVCLGNICRSPLAEGILKHKAKTANKKWIIDSAGTNGYHVGEAPHRLSQKVAKMNGVEICDQKATQFTAYDFRDYDIIYAMADEVITEMKWIAGKNYDASKVKLLMEELYPGKKMDVPDPWYGAEPGYHDVYKMIDEACDAILRKYE